MFNDAGDFGKTARQRPRIPNCLQPRIDDRAQGNAPIVGAVEAKGGAARLKDTTSVRTSGTGTMQGAEVAIQTLTKRPHFVRNEMTLAGQKMVQGFDGETLWMMAPGMPAQALPGRRRAGASGHHEFLPNGEAHICRRWAA